MNIYLPKTEQKALYCLILSRPRLVEEAALPEERWDLSAKVVAGTALSVRFKSNGCKRWTRFFGALALSSHPQVYGENRGRGPGRAPAKQPRYC